MKKSLVAVVLCLGLASVAPKASAQGFYLGVRGGVNVSSVSNRLDANAKWGANFGAMAGYQISPDVAVQVEALYSFQGFNAKLDPSGYRPENLDYLKIPVLAKIYLLGGLNVEAGLSFNFLTSALSGTIPVKGYNGFDLSIPVGLAYGIGRNFEVGVRYDISLVDVSPDYRGANGVFSLNLSWRLW